MVVKASDQFLAYKIDWPNKHRSGYYSDIITLGTAVTQPNTSPCEYKLKRECVGRTISQSLSYLVVIASFLPHC